MSTGIFVTGTDTGCGKTHVAVALIRALRRRGLRVAGFKPVAAGAAWRDGKLQNDDALALIEASGLDFRYPTVNPYCFEPAIAPHLAAAEAGVEIRPEPIRTAWRELSAACDLVVVEGAGGWRVPLAAGFDMQRLALDLRLPVVLVVGLRLGCLNHALLSAQAVDQGGGRLLGWIGSVLDPTMPRLAENITTLERLVPAPGLGTMRHAPGGLATDTDIAGIDLAPLLRLIPGRGACI